MTDQLKIALVGASPTPDNWDNLADVFQLADIPFRPDWTFQKYSGFVDLDNGERRGVGLSRATWAFSGITAENRDLFRDYCPEENLSVEVYIMTPTNEIDASGNIIWFAGSGWMKWTATDEEVEGPVVLNFLLEFDMLESI